MLAQDLHRDRALAGDHVRVVERMHEGQSLRRSRSFERVRVGVGVAVAVQDDLAAERAHGVDLQLRRRHRHDDRRRGSRGVCALQRDALGVVARRGADHAALELLGRQLGHLVVGPAQLEAEDRLRVFALEQHLVAQARATGCGASSSGDSIATS